MNSRQQRLYEQLCDLDLGPVYFNRPPAVITDTQYIIYTETGVKQNNADGIQYSYGMEYQISFITHKQLHTEDVSKILEKISPIRTGASYWEGNKYHLILFYTAK